MTNFPKFTEKQLKEIFEEAEQEKKRRIEEARNLAKDRDEPINKKCPVCQGEIVARYRKKFFKVETELLIGCHKQNELPKPAKIVGFHCANCSVEFYDPLKTKK